MTRNPPRRRRGGMNQDMAGAMKAKWNPLWAILLFMITPALLLSDFELTHWKYFKTIQCAGVSSKAFVSIALDNEVISHAGSLERELRLIEGSSAEMPFDLVTDSDEVVEENRLKVNLFNRAVLEGKYQQLICDLGESEKVTNQLTLETPSRDFVRRADVEGSDDRQHWLSLAQGLHVFDWSEGRKLKLEFHDATYRYLKVVLWLDGGKPLDIQGATVSHQEKRSGELEPVPVALHSRQFQTPQKYSEWLYDFGHGHPLVNRCAFKVANPNFRRRVDLAVSDDLKCWQAGPSLEIFRTTGGQVKDEFTTLETNALNHRYLRIRVQYGDDRPLDIIEILFRRFVRRVVFEFNPSRSYRLFYGNPFAQRASYDLTAMELQSRLPSDAKGSLGPSQINPDFVEPQARQPWSEQHPRLLWTVLIVVVGLLIALLFKSVRSMMGGKP